MTMHLPQVPIPITNTYDGDVLNISKMREAFFSIQGNFQLVSSELARLNIEFVKSRNENQKLVQLLNWIAVTNPQILDEFQATANAFEKLSPRGEEEFVYPQSSP